NRIWNCLPRAAFAVLVGCAALVPVPASAADGSKQANASAHGDASVEQIFLSRWAREIERHKVDPKNIPGRKLQVLVEVLKGLPDKRRETEFNELCDAKGPLNRFQDQLAQAFLMHLSDERDHERVVVLLSRHFPRYIG